jgi:hypothetical protein
MISTPFPTLGASGARSFSIEIGTQVPFPVKAETERARAAMSATYQRVRFALPCK